VSFTLFLRTLWREARGSHARFLFFTACLAVGVAAVVGLSALSNALELGIRARSRELLGGDLALESRRPLPDLATVLPAPYRTAPRVELAILSTMVRSEHGASRLAELKAVDASHGSYPLAGQLVLSPRRPLAALLDDHSVVVAPQILAELELAVGGTLHVGNRPMRIAGVVEAEPDPLAFSFSLGPRVLISRAALAHTKLLEYGNRVRYRSVLALPAQRSEAELAQLKKHLQAHVPGGGTYVNVETHVEAQPALRSTLQRTTHYLSLLALLSLLIASVGVAQTVSAWLARVAAETAVLRCLGLRPREIAALYLGHVLLLASAGSLLGAAVGAVLPSLLAHLKPDLLPAVTLVNAPWLPILRGVGLGVGVALLFSLPALSAVWKVSPMLVLRSEAAPLPVPRRVRVAAFALAALGLLGAALVQSGEPVAALAFAGGTSVLAGLLWLGTRLLLAGVGRLPRQRLPALAWHGAAALARPGAGAVGSTVALGLGTLTVLGLFLLQGILGRELETALPAHAPTVFLADVQPDQWPGIQALFREASATHVESVPVVMARLSAVDGRPVAELLRERPGNPNERSRLHWVLTREQRITTRRRLSFDNEIVDGSLWSDPQALEVSVEEDFARDLGAELGSLLRFDVQGVPVEMKITSLRSVQWRSFSLNFFLVAEPGALDGAPHFIFGAARVAPERELALQNGIAAAYPNVTVLRARQFLERAGGLLSQIALGVRVLGSFALLSGLVILAGAIAATRLKRAREVAVLKTLGLTRARIAGLFALEYALVGVVAGVLGAAGAYLLAFGFARRVLELYELPSLTACLLAVVGTVLLSVLGGLAASARALRVPPLEVLRRQD
jgi:putative ABC transport system permease protein